MILQACFNTSDAVCDLACHKIQPSTGGLMGIEDAAAGKETVGFSVVSDRVVSIELGCCVRAARCKGCLFILRRRGAIAKQFTRARLIETHTACPHQSHSFEQPQNADAGCLCCDMGL